MPGFQRPQLRQAGTRPITPSRGAASASHGAASGTQGLTSRRHTGQSVPRRTPSQNELGASSTSLAEAQSLTDVASLEDSSSEVLESREVIALCPDPPIQSSNCRTLRDESNFIQNVGQFYNQQDISDIVLKIGKSRYYGHKFVLAKSSDVFRTMLYDKNWSQAGLPEIVLEESEECQAYFDTFLRFLYTAEVNISVESAVGILCLADKYSVTSLKNLCTQYMVEHTKSPLVENALKWYSWSKALHMPDLISQCSKTIAWNVEQLLISPDWNHMDIDFVSDMLRNGDLVIPREYLLFKSLVQWLEHEEHLDNYQENAKVLLPLIRFPQMQVHELYEIEHCDMYKHPELGSLLDKLINKAYRFRSLCAQQAEIGVSFNEDFYLPRNYLDLSVDNVRMQNAIRYGIQVDVRTYVGPVPSMARDGEWKIAYRKTNDMWNLQLYCHESALVGGEARIQATVIITNQDDHVVQVEESDTTICSRGNHLSMGVSVQDQEQCKNMAVLVKPLPR